MPSILQAGAGRRRDTIWGAGRLGRSGRFRRCSSALMNASAPSGLPVRAWRCGWSGNALSTGSDTKASRLATKTNRALALTGESSCWLRTAEPADRAQNHHQVRMVRHQAVGPNLRLAACATLSHELSVLREIVITDKGLFAPVSSLSVVVRKTRYDNAGYSGHSGSPCLGRCDGSEASSMHLVG
jgi:hypothetical protein